MQHCCLRLIVTNHLLDWYDAGDGQSAKHACILYEGAQKVLER